MALCCSVCGSRNYKTTRTKREGDPLILRKFCSHCNQHTIHQEGK
ncbi:MAG: 50S ribosomal protein L33 [Myxococcota bacterium]|nr:50S ribosomal protein L33 [Myxococcota bacterium]